MNGFRKMQERLTEEGWFVGWNLPCCQSCAWGDVPLDADFSKVLFNHSQDCEVEGSEEECGYCDGEGVVEVDSNDDDDDDWMDCMECRGTGYADFGDVDPDEYDTSVSGFVCNFPEQQNSSVFCFDGEPQGVENLKAILPIIEECGCTVNWSGSGDQRIEISW